MNSEDILAEARRQLGKEQFDKAVAAEKLRLQSKQTISQRLQSLLPFTITWKSK